MRCRRGEIDVLDADLRAAARRMAAETHERVTHRAARRDPAADAELERTLTRRVEIAEAAE